MKITIFAVALAAAFVVPAFAVEGPCTHPITCTANCKLCGAGQLCIQRCLSGGQNKLVERGYGCGVNWGYKVCTNSKSRK